MADEIKLHQITSASQPRAFSFGLLLCVVMFSKRVSEDGLVLDHRDILLVRPLVSEANNV